MLLWFGYLSVFVKVGSLSLSVCVGSLYVRVVEFLVCPCGLALCVSALLVISLLVFSLSFRIFVFVYLSIFPRDLASLCSCGFLFSWFTFGLAPLVFVNGSSPLVFV